MPVEPRQTLIQALRSESVAIIVGTGVSIGAVGGPTAKPSATWIGLLRDGLRAAARHAGKSEKWVARELEKLQEAFDDDDLSGLLAVASEVEARLEYPDHGAWAQWLRGSFEGWKLADARVPEALVKLGAGRLFTTNYDDVLQIASGGELEPVAYTNERKVARIVRGEANGIVHLHGHWDSPESVVLGRSSYADVGSSKHTQAMQQALASMQTLLFVGFGGGLEDPNFGPLLEWMKTFRGDEHQHFRLARADEVGAVRKAHPSAQRITVMSYGDTHADLPGYLEALARDAELKPAQSQTEPVVVESGDQRELSPELPGESQRHHEKSAVPSPSEDPVLRTPKPVAPPTDIFTGRESELMALEKALVDSGGSGVSVIYGMAGVGKSYLALRFARDHASAFPGGTQSIALATPENRSAVAIVGQLADQLNVAPADLPQRLLSPRSLVVIDNIDTDSNATLAAELVDHLPGSRMLLTGRRHEFGQTAGWSQVELDILETAQAVELLKSLSPATATSADGPLTDLAEALGRLPLALYLASGHLRRGLSPKTILSSLQDHKIDLEPLDPADPRLADAIRAKLRSSLSLSWKTFSDVVGEERATAFAGLGHIPSYEFGLHFGAAACGVEESQFALVIGDAVGLSLLKCAAVEDRWSVHPLVRAFLAEHSPRTDVNERVRTWFETQMAAGMSVNGSSRSNPLKMETGNLVAWLPGLPATVTADVLRANASFARAHGPFNAWADAATAAAGSGAGLPEDLRVVQAALLRLSGRTKAALACAKALAQTAGDPSTQAMARHEVAEILANTGSPGEALRILQDEQLPHFNDQNDVRGVAATQGKIADILERTGKVDEAFRIREEEEIRVFDQHGLDREAAIARGKNAHIQRKRGNLNEALKIHEERVATYTRLGDERELAVTRSSMTAIAAQKGDYDEALAAFRSELPFFVSIGDPRQVALTNSSIARTLVMSYTRDRGPRKLEEALKILNEEALPAYKQLGDVREVAFTYGEIANIRLLQENRGKAEQILRQEVIPGLERAGDIFQLAISRLKLGGLLFGQAGKRKEALSLLRAAYTTLEEMNNDQAETIRALFDANGLDLKD